MMYAIWMKFLREISTDDIRFILNEDGKVAALLINENDADVEDDAIYGVFNARTKKTVDGRSSLQVHWLY